MFPSPSPPACLKRKSTSSTPPTSNKRARLVGAFEPRLIIPTGARRSWTFAKAPRFILDPVTQGAKRTLVEEEIAPSPSKCKVRLLDNRDALFLPGKKRLATKKPQRKRTSISSPSKKSLEMVRLRRRDQFKRQLQRIDSGICMESDEDLDLDTMLDSMSSLESGEDIKFFDTSTFIGFSVEMMEAIETTAEDDMEIEDASISTTTTTTASSEGEADSDSTSAEQATSNSGDVVGLEKDMLVEVKEEKEEKEEDGDSGIDVEIEDTEKNTPEQKEVDNQLSTKGTVLKERIQKRLGIDELIKLGSSSHKRGAVKKEEEADDEEDEPPKRSTRRRSVKPTLPTTVEEEEEEQEEQKERKGDDTVVAVKRRSSKSKTKEEEEKAGEGEGESEKGTEKEGKKGERKEKMGLVRRKVKAEESESETSENEREDEKKLQKKVREEARIEAEEKELEVDEMEEDTDEGLSRSGEDMDMSTDEDIVDFVLETEEKSQVEDPPVVGDLFEDVTMSEDDEMSEEVTGDVSEEQLQKEAKEEIEASKASKETEQIKDIETVDAVDEEKERNNFLRVPTIEVKKSVRRLVLTSSKEDEFEISRMLSVPRTPRSPNMSRFNITMSKAPRKLEPFLSPRRKKFSKFEDLSPHWTMKRLAAKKGQQPFNPANISRHAYRDPTNDEDLLTTRKCVWDDDDVEEPYVDGQYLRVEWPLKSWGSSWMAENGGALIEFCVRKLESFNMAW